MIIINRALSPKKEKGQIKKEYPKKKKQKKDPAKTITKTPKVKLGPIKKQNQKQVTETVHTYQRPQVKKQNYVRQTTRKIVDREQEIYSNSKIVDKDKIVNDIIFCTK